MINLFHGLKAAVVGHPTADQSPSRIQVCYEGAAVSEPVWYQAEEWMVVA